jgi:hypothetical protein
MKTDNYITLLSKIIKASEAIDLCLLCDMKNYKEIYLSLLNIRIYNLVEAIVSLYNANLFPPVAILFRSVIEANLDFENLLKDDEYLKDLNYRYFSEWVRLFDSSQRGNLFLDGLFSNKDTIEMVSLLTKEYDQLRNIGYKGLTIKERFDKVAQSPIYYSVYNISCCESHNNLRTLFNWNTFRNEDETYSIISNSQRKDDLVPYLDSTSAIIINSTIKTLNYFKVEINLEVASFSQELEIIRNSA